MSAPTHDDWNDIHQKAWSDPEFRNLLETDPTAALKQYASENGKEYKKLVTLRSQDDKASGPPACC